jgi:hypothetical protein
VAAADPARALALPVAVEPSQAPVSLQVLLLDNALPTHEVEGDDGPSMVALLEGQEAGSTGVGAVRGRGLARQLSHQAWGQHLAGMQHAVLDGASPRPPPTHLLDRASPRRSARPALHAAGRERRAVPAGGGRQDHCLVARRQ